MNWGGQPRDSLIMVGGFIQCEFGHMLPADLGTSSTTCPYCIERRIAARQGLGLPVDHLQGLYRVMLASLKAGGKGSDE